MAGLSADQRNDYYLRAAIRAGIHKPLLAALYLAQHRPSLSDGEMGLGISPANRIPLEQVNTFSEQVHYAANTIRSLTEQLIAQGWQSNEFWNAEQGHYAERFLEVIATGYVPSANDPTAARLEPVNEAEFIQAYLGDWAIDCKMFALPQHFTFLDPALTQWMAELPRYYLGTHYQQQACLEAARIWHRLETRPAALAALLERDEASLDQGNLPLLDQPLLRFVQQIVPQLSAASPLYPHQREALLRLVQLWHQLPARETAIALLKANPTAETSIRMIDPALMAFLQRLPLTYQGKGDQRNALTETYRLWFGLDSRSAVLQELGVDPQALTSTHANRSTLLNVATQLDRSLLDFVKRLPVLYQEERETQREALIRLVQMWQGFEVRDQALQFLLDQVRRLETARRDSLDAAPRLEPLPLPSPPSHWTPANLQLFAAIVPNGSLTWADATLGGTNLPTHPATVEAIVRMAELAQQAADRIGQPLRVIRWYCPTEPSATEPSATEPSANMPTSPSLQGRTVDRHALGDALEFYCEGLTAYQIYCALEPWWPGGLGRYRQFPYRCYLDAGSERTRWTHA